MRDWSSDLGSSVLIILGYHERSDVPAPRLQRLQLFVGKGIPLIGASNSRLATVLDSLDPVRRDAQALKARRDRAPQIVEAPRMHRRPVVLETVRKIGRAYGRARGCGYGEQA